MERGDSCVRLEDWLISRERLEEMLELLKKGDSGSVIDQLEDILNEMDKC